MKGRKLSAISSQPSAATSPPSRGLEHRAAGLLTRRLGWFIALVLAVTALLALPLGFMPATEPASQHPGGPEFELQDKINARFPPQIHFTSFIVEDPEGDILRQQPLWELYQNEARLRHSDLGQFLYSGYDADTGRSITGVFTIADAVALMLPLDSPEGVTLETATGDQVKAAVSRAMASPLGPSLRASLSQHARHERRVINGREVDYWRSPALFSFVAADNTLLGGGPSAIGSLTADPVTLEKERFNRRVQAALRGEQAHYRLWGVAIDVNLASREQGRTVIPFIAAAVALVLLVVGATLRSWRAVGLALLGLLMLLVWLKGASNLAGLKSSLTLDLLVPIAMISLGVDFFIHTAHRYREERRNHAPEFAMKLGLAGALGATTLALLTDGIAFLANAASGIETVIQFGIGAGIGVVSSYVVMGLFLPLALVRLERGPSSARQSTKPETQPAAAGWLTGPLVRLARLPWLLLPAVAALTVATTYLALQLQPGLDPKDFFHHESDLVVGLDKLSQHAAPAVAGEPATIYLEGDLTAPASLEAVGGLLERLAANPAVGHTEDGGVSLYSRTVLTLLGAVVSSDYARAQVQAATGVAITDADRNLLPDGPEQVGAVYRYMDQRGVPLDKFALHYDARQVRETLYLDAAGGGQATVISFGVVGSREQATVVAARRALERDLEPLRQSPGIASAGLTGSAFTRASTLDATSRALNISMPVAIAGCLALLVLWMRSLPLAVVTVLPILLVVSWLYSFMYLAGFHLNFVTATIGAVSAGVGIDYSIYVTQRFRQELRRHGGKAEALAAAVNGTGAALAGAAASSILGFAVLAFSPMPLFAAYGILTAAMILMSLAASLLVLPCLLLLAAPKAKQSVVSQSAVRPPPDAITTITTEMAAPKADG
ncbi:MAG: hypothetical protein EXR54_05525 [Dehalococcoidia bacterium]|nr:hypothetical protein [Dehalococcoidia bacterium]MSQ17015.1 hypothetical protein [Dehalococcoidia bacterium]